MFLRMPKFLLTIPLVLFFISGFGILKAQETQGFGIESNLVAGSLFKHTARFTGPIPSFSGLAECNLLWKTNGKKDWQIRRHYPTFGLGIAFNYYDNKVYGQSIGVYPMIELPLVKQKSWEWTVRFGMGLGYISKHYKPFAPYWDTLNNAMGADVNNFSLLSSDARWHIDKNWDVQAGITFTHMSSAKFRLPNLGVNFMGLHAGVRYFPSSGFKKKINHAVSTMPNNYGLQMRQAVGMTTGESIGSAATPVWVASIAITKRYWGHNKIYLGADYGYHQNVYNFMRLQAIYPGNESASSWNLGIFAAHEFLYGSVGLYLQMGAYLKQTLLAKAPIYQRLGMKWYLMQQEKGVVKNLYLSTILKTHYATAEYAEIGLGIAF